MRRGTQFAIMAMIGVVLLAFLSGSTFANELETRIVDLNSGSFQEHIMDSEKLVVIDFWAEWCKPCGKLRETIYRLIKFNDKYNKNDISWLAVNIDEVGRKFLTKFRPFRGLPVLLFFVNGKEVDRIIGLSPFTTIQCKIAKIIRNRGAEKRRAEKEKSKNGECSGGLCMPPDGY